MAGLWMNYGNLSKFKLEKWNYCWTMAISIKFQNGTMAELGLNYGYLNLNLKWNYGWTMAELLQVEFKMELWLNYGWILAI